jgi:hypothetical protein
MAFDTSWLRTTALSAAQHAAAVALAGFGGDTVNFWNIGWHDVLGLAGGTALASVLAAIVAYKAPSPQAAAALSVSTGAVQAATLAATEPLPLSVADAKDARG